MLDEIILLGGIAVLGIGAYLVISGDEDTSEGAGGAGGGAPSSKKEESMQPTQTYTETTTETPVYGSPGPAPTFIIESPQTFDMPDFSDFTNFLNGNGAGATTNKSNKLPQVGDPGFVGPVQPEYRGDEITKKDLNLAVTPEQKETALFEGFKRNLGG